MKPGPPKKPSVIRDLEGDPGHRPRNDAEPMPGSVDLARPPSWLPKTAKAEWKRVLKSMPRGVVTGVDVSTLEAYCQCYAEWRDAIKRLAEMAKDHRGKDQSVCSSGSQGYVQVNPTLSVARYARKDMLRFAGELGFTPASRTRVRVVDDSGKNKGDKTAQILGIGAA